MMPLEEQVSKLSRNVMWNSGINVEKKNIVGTIYGDTIVHGTDMFYD